MNIQIQQSIQKTYDADTLVSAWVLVNHQETCYYSLICLVEGYWATKEDAQKAYLEQTGMPNIFEECLFGVHPIEFTKDYWKFIESAEKHRYKDPTYNARLMNGDD